MIACNLTKLKFFDHELKLWCGPSEDYVWPKNGLCHIFHQSAVTLTWIERPNHRFDDLANRHPHGRFLVPKHIM